jgi:hypothetical protein
MLAFEQTPGVRGHEFGDPGNDRIGCGHEHGAQEQGRRSGAAADDQVTVTDSHHPRCG